MDIEKIFEWLGRLNGLPGNILMFILCVVMCAALYKWRRFPSDGIWLCSILMGAVGNVLIADPVSDALSFRVWMFKNGVIGAICGGAAWVLHAAVLKRFLAKIGANGTNTEFLTKPPA